VYVGDQGNDRVVELPAGATSSSQQVTLPFTGLGGVSGVAVDAVGDVFASPYGNSTSVAELPAGATSSSQQVTLPFSVTGLFNPWALAVDAAGNVYLANSAAGQVLEMSGYEPTTVSITAVSPAAPDTGTPFTVDVSVAGAPAAGGGVFSAAPGGQVTVADGTGQTCTATLSGGSGSCQLTEASAGSYTLAASYAGAGAFAASASAGTGITVDAAPAFVTDSPPVTATAGSSYGYTFTASGTPAPTYALASGAPSWLSIDSSTGALSGTVPAGITSFSYTVTAANTAGTATAGPFTVTVTRAPPATAALSAKLACPSPVTVGQSATCTLTVTNNGPDPASSVIAAVALAPQLVKTSCSPACASYGNVLAWKDRTLADKATATQSVTFTARRAGTALVLGAAVSATLNPDPLGSVATAKITITGAG